jgi:hypothetical protein
VKRTIAKAFIHESYNPQAEAFRSHCDISVLRMNDFVEFTPYIQPVCLPVKNSDTNGIIGTSVGFGYHSGIKGFQNTPKQAVMSSISFSDCFLEHLDYAKIVSGQSFCARGQDASPCQSDSGAGYYVLNPRTLQYTTYGVVSSTFKGCSTMDYTVFVDVAQHVNWVNQSERNIVIAPLLSSLTFSLPSKPQKWRFPSISTRRLLPSQSLTSASTSPAVQMPNADPQPASFSARVSQASSAIRRTARPRRLSAPSTTTALTIRPAFCSRVSTCVPHIAVTLA